MATGGAYFERDGSWSGGEQVGSDLVGVSCVSDSWCMALNLRGTANTYDGGSWSAEQTIDPGGITYGLSCADVTFCVAVDSDGGAVMFDGRTWVRSSCPLT